LSGSYVGPQRTKLPFPINILLNQKFFYIFFIVLMIASMAAIGLGNFTGGNTEPAPIVNTDLTPAPTDIPTASFPGGPAPVIDATKPHVATLRTNKGEIKIELADKAPEAVNSFAFLAGSGFYDDTAFFYVEPDYFAQGGDPNCKPDAETLCSGTAGPDYTLDVEESGLKHEQWSVVAPAVPGGNQVHGSQFRILYAPDSRLDGTETVFGRVTDPASQQLLSSLPGFVLCSVADAGACQEGQDFSSTLVIESVSVEQV
jgi:cyclophilin family peptidyl-prolyl cis-trans isomerase